MTIGISGAGGQLGRLTADLLLEQVEPDELVLVTRNPDLLGSYAERGVSVRRGDFDDADALREAYSGVDTLLLISGADIGRRVAQHSAAVDAAKEAGVRRVAYTGIVNPSEANAAAAAPEHRGTEEAILASGLEWTFLRNGIYCDLTVDSLQLSIAAGQHVFNSGDGAISYVTRADCAAAAAAALSGIGHANKAYDITGPEALTGYDLARQASEVSGKEVQPVPVDDQTFVSILVEHAGLPEFIAEFLASFGRAAREGQLGLVSGDFEQLTGRPPQRFRELLEADLGSASTVS
jgi:NAD(P)H dehydrogenase (quinone)